MPMPVVHQFAYGVINPIIAFVMAFVGAELGFHCTVRARRSASPSRRARLLLVAAVAFGGTGIWLMHFMAMVGFDVPASPVRFNVGLTIASLITAIVVVAVGLFIVGFGKPNAFKILLGGIFTGGGVAAMHYTGMAAMHINGVIDYDRNLVVASVVIAVVASIAALWFAVAVNTTPAISAASVIFAVAVCAMHYTGMASVRVHLSSTASAVPGVTAVDLAVPIMIIGMVTIFGLIIGVLLTTGSTDDFKLSVDQDVLNGTARTRRV